MKDWIEAFLDSKRLSANTRAAYSSDIQQLAKSLQGAVVDELGLKLYRDSLAQLSVTAQRRKLSAINQFLLFLYEEGHSDQYHRLTLPPLERKEEPSTPDRTLLAKDLFETATQYPQGQILVALILETGLQATVIIQLERTDLQPALRLLQVGQSGRRRVLELSSRLSQALDQTSQTFYIFEHQGKPYTRQWVFLQIKAYLEEQGLVPHSPQSLREQYIFKELQAGVGLLTIADNLGLRSLHSIEKYRKWK